MADLVLGQTDFKTNAPGRKTNAFSITYPGAVVVDEATNKVFVAELTGNRILRFPNFESLSNGGGAEAVFGQATFSTTTAGSGTSGFHGIQRMFLDRLGRLWVCDMENNRVLMFKAAATRASHPVADRIFGQPDSASRSPGVSSIKMNHPTGVCVDTEDRLWVADYYNSRILRYDSISTKDSGAEADGVLGQKLFTTNDASLDFVSASTMTLPNEIAVSRMGDLYVACSIHNRVLRFSNAAQLENGAEASAVLGQPRFTSISSGRGTQRMDGPTDVTTTTDDSLWVTDYYNRRILRFDNASSKPTGSAADGVVGQSDFKSKTLGTSRRKLANPTGSTVDSKGNLWVADYLNNRVLRFPPDLTRPKLDLGYSGPISTFRDRFKIQGTASDTYGISKVQYRIGSGPWRLAAGTTSWELKISLAQGSNRINLRAVDSVGNESATRELKIKRISNAKSVSETR